jgi:hypothetical protein
VFPMKWPIYLLLLVFLAPHATANVPPLPPGGVDWYYTQNGALVLTWAPVEYTGNAPLENYRIYYTINGTTFPPSPVASTNTYYEWGPLTNDAVYTFWITTVNANSEESAPSTPALFVGGYDYPYCSTVTIRVNPPTVPDVAPGCLLPPPV